MQLMGRYLDGRVSAVLGTHTHVPTADECILPGGTAFQCDVGMTGPYESIIGRRIDRVLETTLTGLPTEFDVATNDVRLGGTIVDVDASTGRATGIKRLCVTEADLPRLQALAPK
jgi:calcineurin-like phosphoesterase